MSIVTQGPAGRRHVATLASLLAAAILSACAGVPGGVSKKQMLVIGNGVYGPAAGPVTAAAPNAGAAGGWAPLANPLNDREQICRLYRDEFRFHGDCPANLPSREAFERVVEQFVDRLQPDSTALFYYSGHGIQIGNVNYLVPTQAAAPRNRADLAALYPMNHLYTRLKLRSEQLGRPLTGLKLIVLDACRSEIALEPAPAGAGSLSAAEVDAMEQQLNNEPTAAGRSFAASGGGSAVATRTLQNAGGTVEISRRVRNRVASVMLSKQTDVPKESILLYATEASAAAFDGGPQGNGPLTQEFLKRVRQRGQNVEDFIKDVTLGVRESTRLRYAKEQAPAIYGTFTGQHCFAGCFDPENFTVPVTP